MLEIQKKQFDRAVQVLDMLGCTYAIKAPDGTTTGTLQLADPVKPKRASPRHDYSLYCIPERVKVMKVGDVDVYKVIGEDSAEGVRSSVSACGSTVFGRGNFTTTVINGEIQCMRTA